VSEDDAKPEADAAPDADAGTADAAKRRFKEALDRKRHREGHGEGAHGTGKSVTQHADMKRQRTFRRKSG
jgi:Family of unknown function (DUF5302)